MHPPLSQIVFIKSPNQSGDYLPALFGGSEGEGDLIAILTRKKCRLDLWLISYPAKNCKINHFLQPKTLKYVYIRHLIKLLLRLSLYVPWNEVVVLSPVQLGRTEVHVQVNYHLPFYGN